MTQSHEVRRQVGEIRVAITLASGAGDVTTTELRLVSGGWPFDPVAPATLSTDDDQPVAELHKLVKLDEHAAAFESYNLEGDAPDPGGPYRVFSWWDHGSRTRRPTPTWNGDEGRSKVMTTLTVY
jgi:hypothetical protein